jgi:DNA-binding transcriptional regulator LsrR (DeoR family)
MRKVRHVLRLKAYGLGKRQIAASLGISATVASACLRRAREERIFLVETYSQQLEDECIFAHSCSGLSDMIAWLLKASGGEPGEIHVAIETPHGPIVEALLERGFNIYSINPKQIDRFRDRFTVARAKEDSLDSYVLADSLLRQS